MRRIDDGAGGQALAQERGQALRPAALARKASTRRPPARRARPASARGCPRAAALCHLPSFAEQRGQRLARLLGPHEGLAHQEGMHAGGAHASARPRGPGCRTRSPAGGRPARPPACPAWCPADLEGAQVAVVDADQRRLQLRARAAARRASCTSTSTAMSRLRAIAFELRHLRVVQAGGDQQDAVGAHRARLVDLVGVDHEVLAQHRQVAGRARLLQVVAAGPGRTGGRSAPTGRRRRARHSSGRCRPG